MGTGPTCDLGSRVPGLAGVILHSPLATGMRVMNPTWTRWPSWLDIFPNVKLVAKISAPTLIMHVSSPCSTPLIVVPYCLLALQEMKGVVAHSCCRSTACSSLDPSLRPLWSQICGPIGC